jgi:hypothetical protein
MDLKWDFEHAKGKVMEHQVWFYIHLIENGELWM